MRSRKIIANLAPQANASRAVPGLAIPAFAMVKTSYTLGVYTRSGLCPLFLYLGLQLGWMRPSREFGSSRPRLSKVREWRLWISNFGTREAAAGGCCGCI